MKGYMREFEKFLHMYVNSRSISLQEDPCVLASKIFEFFSLLTFPHTEDHFLEGLKGKALHTLWCIIIDDIIENTDDGKESISDSLKVVTKYRNRINFSGKTEYGHIMHDFIQRFYNLSSGPNRKIVEELLFLDLLRVLSGFEYERIIQKNDMLITLPEYMEYGAVTTNLRVFLDIDIATYPYNMNLFTIGNLRKAYKWFNLAFRLGSDIATFEKEFFVEKPHNAVIFYGQEKGVLPRRICRTERKYRERLYERVIPSLVDDVKDKGREYLSKSVECLEKINEIDMGGTAKAFKLLFENYLGQSIFSPPVK